MTTNERLLQLIRDEVKEVLQALVGGARYAAKVRLPHAILMTLLFRRELSTEDKLRGIVKIVVEHSRNLASFAAIYKGVLAFLKLMARNIPVMKRDGDIFRYLGATFVNLLVHGTSVIPEPTAPPGLPERMHHALIAGSLGGYFIWGKYSSLNYQILLYLSSRVLLGVWKRVNKDQSHPKAYSLAAAAIWGLVMLLFEESPEVLHPSLKQSMDEIYRTRSFMS